MLEVKSNRVNIENWFVNRASKVESKCLNRLIIPDVIKV